MSHHDHIPKAFRARSSDRLRALTCAALAVLLSLTSVPALAQYEYRRTITVDRTKVTNPATFPIAWDAVSSAKTADAGAASLSWSHTIGSGNDRIAIVSVSSKRDATGAITFDNSATANTGASLVTSTLNLTHTPTAGSNRLAIVSVTTTAPTPPAYVGTATGVNTDSSVYNSRSWTHTVPAGNNRLLIVGVAIRRNTAPNNQTVLSVTWQGTALTRAGQAPNGANCTAELWYLAGPAVVTNGTIVVTLAAGATARFTAGAMNFTGVDQTNPLGTFVGATGGTSPASVAVPTGPQELVVDVLGQVDQTYTSNVGASQTQRWNGAALPWLTINGSPNSNDIRIYGSHKAATATSTTMSWTITGSTPWSYGAVALKGPLPSVTTVTYAGTNITANLIGTATNPGRCAVSMYYMVNPPAAANAVSVTLSVADSFVIAAASFFGVHQTTPFGTFQGSFGLSGTASVTVSSATSELVVDALALQNDALSGNATSPQTQRWGAWTTVGTPNGVNDYGSSRAGATSTTMSWAIVDSVPNPATSNWAIGAVPLKPAVPPVTITQVMFGATNITANLIGTALNATNCEVSMYYLLNPTAGVNTVSVTQSASTRFVAGAFSLFNVSQTTPFGTFASAIDSGTGGYFAQYFVTSANGEIAVAGLAKTYNDAITQRAQNQQADRWNVWTSDATPANNIVGIGTLRGGAASASFYWDLTGLSTQQIAFGGVSVKPTTVGPPVITTLSNYPMLVSLSDSTLKDTAHGGHIWNANGWDIEFRASDGTTKLDYEIEKYDGAAGQVVAWVRLPSVNGAGSGSNTQIYIYYGYKKIAGPTQNKTAVWDANYMEVWHLGEPSGNATESTSHGYTATVQPNPGTPTHPAAKIDGGFHFAGDSWLLTNDGQITTANTPLTFESWFYLDSVPQTWVGIVTKNRDVTPCTASPPPCDWAGIWSGGSGELAYGWDWHSQGNIDGGTALAAGTWYYAALTFDGGIRTGFRNGLYDTIPTQPNPSPGTYSSLTMPTRIDSDLTGGTNIVGTIDEVRISTVARTPGWILTTYDNMNNPGNIGAPGFYTVGNEDFLRFNFRRLITILDSMTPAGTCSSNLASFPLLVSITNDANLKTVANGGHVQNANGYDIVFRAMDDLTQLDHEIESYDGVNGTLVAWVRIPTLLYNAATTFYMYYGNPGVSSPTANPAGVWDSNFIAVWHLKENPTDAAPQFKDSTSHANHGTAQNAAYLAQQAGRIGGSVYFNNYVVSPGPPHAGYISTNTGASVKNLTQYTVSAWVKPEYSAKLYGLRETFYEEFVGTATNSRVKMNVDGVGDYLMLYGRDLDGGAGTVWAQAATAITPGTWYYVAGVFDSVTDVHHLFANGVDATNTVAAAAISNTVNATPPAIGHRPGAVTQEPWFGWIDELRISSVARSVCWNATEYNNESAPGTYVTVDPEQAVSAFAFRRAITIPDSMTPASCGANLSNFPVLVSFTDVTLKSKSNGGNVQSDNGYDIVFRAADGFTALDHEIETYVATTGQLVAWVRIPTLVYNAATTIYMYYGNAAITSPTANPTGVWDTSYKAVWHLKDTTGATVTDSTTNPDNGTPQASPPQTAGQIDGSLSFNGTTQYVLVNNSADLQLAPPFTISSWVKTGSTDTQFRLIVAKWLTGQTPPAKNYWFGKFWTGTANVLRFYGNATQYADFAWAGPPNIADNAWHHVVGVASATTLTLYIDGTQQTPVAYSGVSENTGTSALHIASSPDSAGQIWSGGLDEVRLSSAGRDACWVGTEYNSMKTPATVGVEAANAPTAVELVSLDATEYPGRGVLVSWRTGFEVDNLGFHVYRDQGGQRVRVTSSLVAGSALFAGAGTPLTAGRSYAWWDRSPVSGASYWLEEWELSGERRWHGPVSVQLGAVGVQAQGLATAPSRLLAGLGQALSPSPPQGVRRRLRQALASSQDRLAVQWGLASRPAVRLLVSEEGWYRVSQEELVRAGLDPAADPGRLQLFADGLQVPILVDVRQQGVFASGDGIEFYGEGLDTPSTAVRVYWLTVGLGEGLRVREALGGGQWAPGPVSFPYEVERADRTLYFPGLLNGDEDNFFGAVVTATPVMQIVRVQHVDQGGQGELVVRLQGGTAGAHRVGVELNGTRVGTVAWEGMTDGELVVPVGGHMILEGDNLVVLVADGGEGDVSAVESIRIRYAHRWEADGEGLKFSLGGYQEVGIGGFAGAQVKVLDITDPSGVQALPVEVVKEGEAYQARVGVPEPGERTLLAVGAGAIRHPVGVLPNRPTAWHQAGSGADLLIIGHRSLLPALEPLRSLRESQGLKVAVVDVESVYDEFSFGAKSPQAIKDFLACAINTWSRPPRYLLLVGDASYDPRSYLGQGYLDLVPTKLVDTKYLETASDDWFADFDGDGIADIPVGRLPVQTSWEAATVVGKIVAYEGSSASPRVLLVADANDKGNDFEGLSGQVKAVLPSSVTVAQVFRGQLWDAAQSQLASQLNLGQAVVNYIGHGSNEVWRGNLLTTDAALQLKHDRLPLWLSMTCLNGYFQAPYGDSLAEALLKAPSGGAAAVWASSGLTESNDQLPIDEALVRLLFSGTTTTLGDATLAAKRATKDLDVRRTWILFGDPTTTLKR